MPMHAGNTRPPCPLPAFPPTAVEEQKQQQLILPDAATSLWRGASRIPFPRAASRALRASAEARASGQALRTWVIPSFGPSARPGSEPGAGRRTHNASASWPGPPDNPGLPRGRGMRTGPEPKGLKRVFQVNRNQTSRRPWHSSMTTVASATVEEGVGPPGLGLGGAPRDKDLWFVLEIASDEELQELADALYGKSLLSPLMKSLVDGDGAGSAETGVPSSPAPALLSPMQERDLFLSRLEARFFFLSADARATLRGQRPTYRAVLLSVKEKLRVPCSAQLGTEDLEAEIFLHLCHKYGDADQTETTPRGTPSSPTSEGLLSTLIDEAVAAIQQSLSSPEQHASPAASPLKTAARERRRAGESGKSLKSAVRAALDMAKEELLTTALKGGSALTLSSIRSLLVRYLTKRLLMEKAQYQVASLLVSQGSKVAARQITSLTALYASRQGVTATAARYVGLQSALSFLWPIVWGAFLSDMFLQSVGTDYARIVRAIYTIAQIRLTRTYGWTQGPQP